MRHFTFVVPPLAVLAGFGLHALLKELERRWRPAAATVGAAIVVLLTWNAVTLVRLHPHQYLYYNALVGGLQGAAGRYATDYWSNAMPEAVAALQAFLRRTVDRSPPHHFNVSICAEPVQFEHIAPPWLHLTEEWEDAHFFISTTHMDCDAMLKGAVVATVERLGIVIAVVKDRRSIVDPATAKKQPGGSESDSRVQ
jgi:hypothetical protein